MIAQLMCLTVGHHYGMRQDGSHTYAQCLRCGTTTPGWSYGEPAKDIEGSQAYWDAIYDDCVDAELALHGGG